MPLRKLLIIKACGVPGEDQECDNIKNHAELYNIEVTCVCPKDNSDLERILDNGIEYDYIYLSSHGNAQGFSNSLESINFTWYKFGVLLCETRCMGDDCVVMLSCCRGGLNQISYLLFHICPSLSYVVGPRQNLCPNEMLIGFNLLLFNIEHRRLDPVTACKKIELGTDIRFVCFDRIETEGEMAFMYFKASFEMEYREEIEEARADFENQSAIPVIHAVPLGPPTVIPAPDPQN